MQDGPVQSEACYIKVFEIFQKTQQIKIIINNTLLV